jgi:hypothetical protein
MDHGLYEQHLILFAAISKRVLKLIGLSLWGGQYRNYIVLKIGHDLEGSSHQLLGGTDENHETLSQDSRCPGQDLNQASDSY